MMEEARRNTREMFSMVRSERDLRRSPAEGFRPLLWHLGHVGAFEAYWILERVKGDRPISERYNRIFDPIKTPREDSTNLPAIEEIEDYLARVREQSLSFLASSAASAGTGMLENGYVFDMVIEHEWQHQETLAYLLQMLDPSLKAAPGKSQISNLKSEIAGMARIEGGAFEMGARGRDFAYDNERPAHTVELADFRIDRRPVTNAEFAQFIKSGGYQTRSLWSDEGWAWKEEHGVACPLYWSRTGEEWLVREMFEYAPLKADHPVTGVSWYEASSYARFAGKRLPTEAEWEKAASWDPGARAKRRYSWGDSPATSELANFNFDNWGTTAAGARPAGQSAYGCFDMTGNVWEWTSSEFAPYPGFKAYPYAEYSELWFDGDHRVMKGGSWATRGPLLRCSFRNFWRPRFRYAIAGFRCAAD
ncbi:MAG TPA: ergothioneine biosynthesis protein EgtB [Blastocatellia bacterium]|jgi:iron(II)-dependent oxidoreductase